MKNATIRIYQLANELGLNSKDILLLCQALQWPVKAATSSLSLEQADRIRNQVNPSSTAPATEESEEPVTVKPSIPQVLYSPQYFFNRELSWLWFNERVLHEAFDPRNPLLERLKFLAIFSNNLDEYFMVRVSGLMRQVAAQVTQRTQDGMTPEEQLDAICQELQPVVARQHRYFDSDLREQLSLVGIHVLNYEHLSEQQVEALQTYFQDQIFPVLTPLAVDPGHPFPYISNLSLNLAVVVRDRASSETHFARVKVPDRLPRFVALPIPKTENATIRWWGVPLEQVIARNLPKLFPGMEVQTCHPFRITRNADFELEEDEADDLLLAIEQELRKRRFGTVVRMEIQVGTPPDIQKTLMEEMGLSDRDVYAVEGLLCLSDLFALSGLPFPELKDPPWSPVIPPRLKKLAPLVLPEEDASPIGDRPREDDHGDLFATIRAGDLLVHHPYESFSASVQRFITEAAYDPNVLTIKITLYRTAGDSKFTSPIVNSLIAAAENGKQVVALVELKARFDEENNILWAKKLEKVGAHVVYGLVGLKTHTKVALVVRREGQQLRRYVHIGTGNYNPKTARLYTDLGLFSCREDLGADLTDLFNHLTGYSRQLSYRKILVAPVNLRDRMVEMIQREAELQRRGKQGRIIAKMNSLLDVDLIAALYAASQAGVQIDLIIRGNCALKPAIQGISDNIRVMSIIGRFLEHERIFYFHNNGRPKVFFGSADWRPRNLDRRVEAIVPIDDPALSLQLRELLDLYLADNRHAWDLQPDGQYIQRRPGENDPERSAHRLLMKLALQ
ncbi:MAG: polyphosphate kinase 1 [Thermosynechococcaceae cyanobacterium]